MDYSTSSTNVSLLIQVQDPDNHDAWALFDAKYRPLIAHFCQKKFAMSPGDADEAAQDVLVKLVSNMRAFQYDSKRSFRAWLSTVARNSVIDGMRKKRPDRAIGGSEQIDRLGNVPAKASEDEDELAEKLTTELRQTLFDECESLVKERVNEQTWNAFTMLRAGKKAAEVGDVLDMKIATVYRAKTRVLKLFREEVTLKLQMQSND
jgi:RNA polymerase sigma-70 factor (ECF subfamily)